VTLKTPITLNSPLPNPNISIVGDGTTATVTTQNTHSLYTGMVVFIQGSTSFNSPMPYPVTSIIDDKTYTFASGVVANDTPAGVTLSILNLAIVGPGGGAAYVTTLNPHGLSAGMVVLIKGSNSFDNLVPYTVTTIIDETNMVVKGSEEKVKDLSSQVGNGFDKLNKTFKNIHKGQPVSPINRIIYWICAYYKLLFTILAISVVVLIFFCICLFLK
jgi:hypothetical protein